jgi:hypothetical protein
MSKLVEERCTDMEGQNMAANMAENISLVLRQTNLSLCKC